MARRRSTRTRKARFPLFDADKFLAEPHCASRLPKPLKAQIRAHGIRNSHLLSIAPTGTISLAFAGNASGGIEPTFSWTYIRKKRMPDGSKQEYIVEDYAYRLFRRMGGDESQLPAGFVSALEMSASDHMQMIAAVQPYVDAAISKTVNVPGGLSVRGLQEPVPRCMARRAQGHHDLPAEQCDRLGARGHEGARRPRTTPRRRT